MLRSETILPLFCSLNLKIERDAKEVTVNKEIGCSCYTKSIYSYKKLLKRFFTVDAIVEEPFFGSTKNLLYLTFL